MLVYDSKKLVQASGVVYDKTGLFKKCVTPDYRINSLDQRNKQESAGHSRNREEEDRCIVEEGKLIGFQIVQFLIQIRHNEENLEPSTPLKS